MNAIEGFVSGSQAGGHVWYPCTPLSATTRLTPPRITSGKGAWLYDAQGRRYLDGMASWWVNLFGHNFAPLNEAIKAQLDDFAHTLLAGFTHEPVEQLSTELAALTQYHLPHCFYASDGASAVEIALKMSVHAWRNQGLPEKNEFVSLSGGYHGETLGALSVSDVAIFKQAYSALLRPAHQVISPDLRGKPADQTETQWVDLALGDLEQVLQQHGQRIAALILEPLVQCAGGMGIYPPRYLTLAKRLCEQYQVHLIADEIAVGCGRTGTFFASEQAGVWPDFLCLSKGITGGYLPLSVVLASEAIHACFRARQAEEAFLHSHSYTGNALACRAALATLAVFRQDDVLQRNKNRARQLIQALAPWYAHPCVRHARHLGMIWAFDVQLPSGMSTRDFSLAFRRAAMDRELFLRPLGNTVYMMPPYCLDQTETSHLAQASLASLNAVLEGAGNGER